MSLGPVMLDIAGTELTREDREVLLHPHVGGVILFSRNFESVEQLQHLVKAIHQLRKPRLLIAVDHEGGRVQRFQDGFTRLPAAARLGHVYDHDHARGKYLAKLAGWLMAVELRAQDIDFSFAPVLDVDHKLSQVIGDRAFHHDPQAIVDLAHSYMQGMANAGMAATGKHFPGHGGVSADSHLAIPVDSREYNDIYAHDILPFRKLIGYGLSAIMPAHVIYEKVDKRPAGFSSFWLQDVLRNRLRFQGVIFSDDLDMKGAGAIGDKYIDRAQAALGAGCDMVLVCNNRPGAIEVLERLGDYTDPVAHLRLARMHGKLSVTSAQLHTSQKWRDAVAILNKYIDNPTLAFDF